MARRINVRWSTTEEFSAVVTIDDDQVPTEMDIDDLVVEVEEARNYTGTTDRTLIEWSDVDA